MSKQDRQGARTVAELERRLNTRKTLVIKERAEIAGWDIDENSISKTKNISISLTDGTVIWEQKVHLEPDGVRIVLTYKNGNPVPTIKELEKKIYWYQLAGINTASAFEE